MTQQDVEKALARAEERHKMFVQKALSNYDTTTTTTTTEATTTTTDRQLVDRIVRSLREYRIEAPGQLPDFADLLPRAIYVTDPIPLFTKNECRDVIRMAEDHFAANNNNNWTMQRSGQYEVAGFWIRDIPAVQEWFVRMVRSRLFPLLAKQFPDFVSDPSDLCVDNAYLFKYTPETGRRTDIHIDSGCLSFTIALNEPNEEYTGGGTWFEGLQQQQQQQQHPTSESSSSSSSSPAVVEMHTGQVTIRPGGVKHAGHAVKSGTRYIIGGFCMNQKKVESVRMLLATSTCADVSDEEKKTCLEVAVILNPACDAAYSLLANHYEDVDGDPLKAQQVLEYCLQHVHPASGEIAYSLGSIAMKQKDYARAKECMDICLAADEEDVDAMVTAAQALAGLGRKDEEQTMWQRLVATPGASASTYATAYCNLGVLHQGEASEMEYYQAALVHSPDSFAPRYSLASCYGERHEYDKAIEHFRMAVSHADTEENTMKALHGLYRATTFFVQSDKSFQLTSQEAIMGRFKELMGSDNLERLKAATQQGH